MVASPFAPSGSEPTPEKARTAMPGDNVGALTHEIPNEVGSVVLEHQENRPLIDGGTAISIVATDRIGRPWWR